MLSEKSTAHLPDSDLYEALATLGQDPVLLRPERAHQIRQLMLAELDAQQARPSPAGWLYRLLARRPGRRRPAPGPSHGGGGPGAGLGRSSSPAAPVSDDHRRTDCAGQRCRWRGAYRARRAHCGRRRVDAPSHRRAWRRCRRCAPAIRLDSDADASASIQFPAAAYRRWDPTPAWSSSQLQERTATSPLVIAMHLERGAMRSAVAGLRPDVDKFELSMPGLVAHVKGTVFRVNVTPA